MRHTYHYCKKGNLEWYLRIKKGKDCVWVDKIIRNRDDLTMKLVMETRLFHLRNEEQKKEYKLLVDLLKPMFRSRFQKRYFEYFSRKNPSANTLDPLEPSALLEKISAYMRAVKKDQG